MYANCRKAGLKPPVFRLENGFFILTIWRKNVGRLKPQPGAESGAESVMLAVTDKPLSMSEISAKVGRTQVTGALKRLVQNLLSAGLIERTIPAKPNSRLQKYRLTKKGVAYLRKHGK